MFVIEYTLGSRLLQYGSPYCRLPAERQWERDHSPDQELELQWTSLFSEVMIQDPAIQLEPFTLTAGEEYEQMLHR